MKNLASCQIATRFFDQCYNAQASVDIETILIVGSHVTNATNDKQQIDPSIDELNKLPADVANIEDLLADTGYNSEHNLKICIDHNINLLIAQKRDKHHPSPEKRFKEPEPLDQSATDIEKAYHRLKTQEEEKIYAKRKSTVERYLELLRTSWDSDNLCYAELKM